jgi:hypothetical protein
MGWGAQERFSLGVVVLNMQVIREFILRFCSSRSAASSMYVCCWLECWVAGASASVQRLGTRHGWPHESGRPTIKATVYFVRYRVCVCHPLRAGAIPAANSRHFVFFFLNNLFLSGCVVAKLRFHCGTNEDEIESP